MIRALLIWLLVLALPVQGALAATTVSCGPNHAARAATTAVGDTLGTGAARLQHVSAAHADADATDRGAEPMAAEPTATPDELAPSDVQTCSVCASCCSSAAIHEPPAKLPVVEPAAAHFAALAPAVEPFAAGGPERPPRPLLA